jgi:hypothetical protein
MPKHGQNLGPIDEKQAEGLRGQLAQYRADCLERKQPLRAQIPETGDARLSEILEPLYAVTPETHRAAFATIIEREKTIRLQRIQETYEYAVLEAFDSVVVQDTPDGELILTEAVVDAYNQRHASKPTTTRSVGRTLARLGFRADREISPGQGHTHRGYRLKRALLKRLKTDYGFDSENVVPSLPSRPSTLDGILPTSVDDEQTTLSSNGTNGTDGTREVSHA